MKQISLKLATAFILSAVIMLSSCRDGSVKSAKDTGKTNTKPATIDVPKVVTESFYKVFPAPIFVHWYSYPFFVRDYEWYQYQPSYLSDHSSDNFYIAEFTNKDTITRAVYDKNGQKIALHQEFRGELPEAITDSIKEGDYRSWTMAQEKEQIFKDSRIDQIKVYRVVMEKGDKKHTLYFQQNGKMLKDVKVS